MEPSNPANEERSSVIERIIKECLQLWSGGETFDEVELVDRYPELAPELERELRKIRLVRNAAQAAVDGSTKSQRETAAPHEHDGLRVRCPHCRHPMEVIEESLEIQCNSCGGSVSFSDEAGEESVPAKYLGHFRLEEKLGTGAFGTVWRARDEELDRDVAIKIPRRSQLDPTQAEQFFREARIAAQLNHPNIVSVHEIGREGDTVYIVSDLVDGVPLSNFVRDRSLALKGTVELCETLAIALQHAHELGVVHRDLKPANVMMDSDHEPRIMDFGLAKRDVGEITMTRDGQVLGTPAYMSPEQAKGDAHRVDGRSDVYSLGVMLFEMLTGELPFRGTAGMMIEQVINEDAPSPRRFVDSIPRDLETICLKCLSKERTSRYPSAKLVAEELGRFRRGEPILARPISSVDRGYRWCKRNPMAALAMSLVAFLAVAGPAYAWQERGQRRELQTRLNERANMIAKGKAGESNLSAATAQLTRSPIAVTESSRKRLASAALKKYTVPPESSSSLKRLVSVGVLLAATNRNPEAIRTLELAHQRVTEQIKQEPSTALLLTQADLCVWLGHLHRNDFDVASKWAKRGEEIAAKVLDEDPSLAAAMLRNDARKIQAVALNAASRGADAVSLMLSAPNREQELFDLMPESDEEVYRMAYGYFLNRPQLLP